MTTVEAPYDAEVEYLESTGTQYIDTGVYFDNDSVLDISAEIRCIGTSNIGLISGGNNSGRALEWYIWIDHAECYVGDSSTPDFERALSVGNRIDLSVADGLVSYHNLTKGTTVTVQYSYTKRTAFTVSLFALHRSATGYTYRGKYRIYKALIGALDLIPVRFTNELGQSEGAMYDKVSGQLFRNQGTGAFLYGADVRPYSTPVMGLHFMREPATAKSYVQTGLIAMWDGIENAGLGSHDAAATTWKDLTGNGYDLINNGAIVGENCFTTGTNYGWVYRSGAIQVIGGTVELVFKPNYPSGWQTPVWLGTSDGITNSGNTFYLQGHYDFYGISIGSGQTVSLSSSGIRANGWFGAVNGIVRNDFTRITTTWSGSSYTSLGGSMRSASSIHYRSGCDFFALRLYSRALTAAEVAANYAIDKERFNLP